MEGLPRNVAAQVPSCKDCLSLLLPGEGGRDSTCVRCEQVNELLSLVMELKEEVERLRAIRECEWETDWWSDLLVCQKEGCQGDTPRKVVDPLLCHSWTDLTDEEDWKRVPTPCHGSSPCLPSPLPQLPLSNSFEMLEIEGEVSGEAMEDLPRREPKTRQSPPCLATASVRKEGRVIMVGDSLLRGTEGPICRPDLSHQEVCCLPEAWVRDVTRKLPGLVRSTDYFPLLIVQVGSDEIAQRSLQMMKRDFRVLGCLV